MTMKYCPNCRQNVNVERKYSVFWLIIGWIFALVPGLIYTIVILARGKKCPICQTPYNVLEAPHIGEVVSGGH